LATAVAAVAGLVVTGDDDPLVVGTDGGIAIVSARRLLEIFGSGR
jgi:hypothetical protein